MMRAYRLLLRLYPASFRHEYGHDMCLMFAERRRQARGWAVIGLWFDVTFEVLANAALVHWDFLQQDVRYAARTLARSPGFTFTAILMISVGIGATTGAFSITDFVLIRPLPFPHADRLVKLWEKHPGYSRTNLSPANYRDMTRVATSLISAAAFRTMSANVAEYGDPERLEGVATTADLFAVVGVQPAVGRSFTAADDRDGAPGTVIISDGLWVTYFGRDVNIIGRAITLNDEPFVVIGVMPRDFYFPTRDTQIWIPIRFAEAEFRDRNNNFLEAIARLRDGLTLRQANAEIDLIAAQLRQKYPAENEHTDASLIALRDELSPQSRDLLFALCSAALCVLLIASANLANLLLGRALERRRELAVRTALGADRDRLARQLATEGVLIAGVGGAIGLCVAVAAVQLSTRLVPHSLPIAETPALDLRLLLFASALTATTGLGFSLFPVLPLREGGVMIALRESARGGGGSKDHLRSMLVVAEIVASIVLVTSSGLLLRALWKLQHTDPGFRTENVLTVTTRLPVPKYSQTAKRVTFYDRVLAEVRALPGVTSAAYISFLPIIMRGGIWPVKTSDQAPDRLDSNTASLRYVTPGFFASMGIPIRSGRDVSERDTFGQPWVAIISESLAKRHWPGRDPIGRHFEFALHDRVVVGVAGDIRVRGLEGTSEPQVYVPYKQVPDGSILFYTPGELVIHSADATNSDKIRPSIRAIVRQADPQQPIASIRTMAEIVETDTAPRAVQVRAIGTFAAIAVLLAGIGIHGVLSFAIGQRTQEIGVRVALGARWADILSLVVRRAVVLTFMGLVPGVGLAYTAGRSMQALLAGITPADVPTYAAAIGVTIVMTAVGSVRPTIRALGVDPITAIRTE
jgi:putative ABC transport system permease protein